MKLLLIVAAFIFFMSSSAAYSQAENGIEANAASVHPPETTRFVALPDGRWTEAPANLSDEEIYRAMGYPPPRKAGGVLRYLAANFLMHLPDAALWFAAAWALFSRKRIGLIVGILLAAVLTIAYGGMWRLSNPPTKEEAAWLLLSLMVGCAVGWLLSPRPSAGKHHSNSTIT